jgi:hypothetical protein
MAFHVACANFFFRFEFIGPPRRTDEFEPKKELS